MNQTTLLASRGVPKVLESAFFDVAQAHRDDIRGG